MRTVLFALLATAAASDPHATEHAGAPPAEAPKPAAAAASTPTGLPFAAELAQGAAIVGPTGWHGPTGSEAWTALVKAKQDRRQSARWAYALGLIGAGRGAEALGVLQTMRRGDADLDLVAQFQLANGVALAMIGHNDDAVAALDTTELAGNPEACAWRMLANAHAGHAEAAIRTVNCGLSAINARSAAERAPFVLAASEAAIEAGQPKPALAWLKLFNDKDSHANALRGRALLAAGDIAGGTLRLQRAIRDARPEDMAEIKLSLLESSIATHRIAPPDAIKQLEAIRYGWRGGPVERRALSLEYRLATEINDPRATLRSGATLFRWFKLGPESAGMLAQLQATLGTLLSPESGVPLPEAAGLYWEYRELAPAGAAGDVLVLKLADRLQGAGLYARAAELLQYQLMQRMQDVAQGPLSIKVAALHILAGKPERAIQMLHETEQASYSPSMQQDRKRMEAVALHRLGRDDAAMAALEGVPDAAAVRAEIHWRSKDWASFAVENEGRLPAPKALSEPAQAAVLRQAVALAMLGREDRLKALRARYAAAFAGVPSREAFDVLTRDPSGIDPGKVAAAMAAIPQASPAGPVGNLFDAAP
ncbi:hypothetical protein ACG3SL_12140 [Sphingomonas sp. CJ20]